MKDSSKTKNLLIAELNDLRKLVASQEGAQQDKAQAGAFDISGERFRALVTNLPGLVYRAEVEAPWRLLYISDAVESLTGHPAGRFLSGEIMYGEIIHPDDGESVAEAVNKAVEDRTAYEIEYRILTTEGKVRWVHDRGTATYDSESKPLWLEGVALDITGRKEAEAANLAASAELKSFMEERTRELSEVNNQLLKEIKEKRRAEAELRKSEQLYRDLYESMPLAYFMSRMDGSFLSVNQAAVELTGFSREELLKKSAIDKYADTPSGKSKARRIAKRIRKGEKIQGEELQLLRADGEIRWVSLSVDYVPEGDFRRAVLIDITERHEAKKKLEKSEKWFRGIFESIVDAVFVVSPDREIININSSASRMFGYTLEEISKLSTEFVHVDHQHYVEFGTRINAAFEQNKIAHFEFEVKRKNGEIFPSEHTVSKLQDNEGNFLGIVSVVKDISKRKQAEEEIERMASIVKYSSDFIGIADLQGHTLFLNSAGRELVGIEDDEQFLGTMMSDYFTDADREILEKEILPELMDSGRWSGDLHFRHFGTGAEIPVFFDIFRIDHPTTGEPINFATVTRDITEREQAKIALEASAEKHRALIENLNDFIIILDKDGIITWSSPASRQLDMEPEDVIGISALEFAHPDGYEQLKETLEYVVAHPGEIVTLESQKTVIPNGETLYLNSTFAYLPDTPGINGIVVVAHNNTAQVLAQEKIEKSLIEKEILLKEIHHRVKNNLQIISSLLQLQANKLDNAELASAFTESRARIMAMALLHEHLYQFDSLAEIEAAQYMHDLVAYLSDTYTSDRQSISIEMKADDVSMNLDTAIPVGLIINELVTNAMKHAFPQGRKGIIRLSLVESDGDCKMIISDDGVGLPKDGARKRSSLGLELVENLVSQLEGNLVVRDDAGVTYEITCSNTN